MRRINVNTIFIEVYNAYPASMFDRFDVNYTNSIILPPSALAKLSIHQKDFGSKNNPVLFRILNIELNISTYCSVLDFTAEENTCYLPQNMFERLCLQEGQAVNIRDVKLEKGKYVKIRPHQTEFIDLPEPKIILENEMRKYYCVTKGDVISIYFNKKEYKLDIMECKPKDMISLVNCDIEIDFETPRDYKEYQEKREKQKAKKEVKKELTKEEIQKRIIDDKFSGNYVRMDGKKITRNQIDKIQVRKEKENKEENYNPKEHRIITKNRTPFHYVGSFM